MYLSVNEWVHFLRLQHITDIYTHTHTHICVCVYIYIQRLIPKSSILPNVKTLKDPHLYKEQLL